ncbi:hypothetical protein [Vibrio lentus]|uniref:hypothetical protein n=1 Tax=Vibrio lentus TaxID=136468 RepID=UPI000C8208A6|nr:hypothetical protein [Vibrio lentus]PMJ81297.1 hypothetical protein BCU14_18590 [Vibrio lentus]PMN40621.1 hypothetical protein BCT33_18665 [Vibrio lentus]PMN60458.1 hypothetical protein BCT29_21195 [Vibrio lentus]
MQDIWLVIIKWNWSGIIQAVSGVTTAVIACFALSSWKIQQKSAKVNALFDELISEVNEFIRHAAVPAQFVKLSHIQFESHKGYIDLDNSLPHPEVIYVIKEFGDGLSKQVIEALEPSGQNATRIKSLLIRLQLHQPLDFEDCINACNLIVWQHDRMQAFAMTLGSSNMKWENPIVIKSVENSLSITAENIEEHINKNYSDLLRYITKTYKSIYHKPRNAFKKQL